MILLYMWYVFLKDKNTEVWFGGNICKYCMHLVFVWASTSPCKNWVTKISDVWLQFQTLSRLELLAGSPDMCLLTYSCCRVTTIYLFLVYIQQLIVGRWMNLNWILNVFLPQNGWTQFIWFTDTLVHLITKGGGSYLVYQISVELWSLCRWNHNSCRGP